MSESVNELVAASRLPVIAIVGRPNSGKSTLFNRLIREQRAIVHDTPGVTRDRNVARGRWHDHEFMLVDTGGFEEVAGSKLNDSVRAQADLAAEEADAVIVVLDGREGVNPIDREFVQRLRRLEKPVLFAANKLDSPQREDDAVEFFALGIDKIFPISAAHGIGVADLLENLFESLPPPPESQAPREEAVTLAIVGRPNAGKSSLLNRIVGYERSIVDSTPGTTRDTVDTFFEHGGHRYLLVDTAGIRRRPRVQEQLERSSVVRALRAIERAEVALVVLDATQKMSDQDARIAGYAWERGRAVLLVVNKWDALEREARDRKKFAQAIGEQYPTLGDIPITFVSALTGRFLENLFPAIDDVVATHRKELRTPELNRVLEAAVQAQPPPSVQGRRPRLLYVTQTGRAPIILTIFCSRPDLMQSVYERYLANSFRDAFDLGGTPFQLRFRKRPSAQDTADKAAHKGDHPGTHPAARAGKNRKPTRGPRRPGGAPRGKSARRPR